MKYSGAPTRLCIGAFPFLSCHASINETIQDVTEGLTSGKVGELLALCIAGRLPAAICSCLLTVKKAIEYGARWTNLFPMVRLLTRVNGLCNWPRGRYPQRIHPTTIL